MSIASRLVQAFGDDPPSPSYPVLPAHDEHGETARPGVYVVGEAAGTPLIRLGLQAGATLAQHLRRIHEAHLEPDGLTDVVVVGAGAAGLSTALSCKTLGLSVVVLEAASLASTVSEMYHGKHLYDEPASARTPKQGAPAPVLWFGETSREELLERWATQVKEAHLDIREGIKVTGLTPLAANGAIARRDSDVAYWGVETQSGERHTARRVVLAIGKSGPRRRLGVPGEDDHAARILMALQRPSALSGKRVAVVGGGDTACETALALVDAGAHTTMIIRRAGTIDAGVGGRLRQAVRAAADAGTLTLVEGQAVVAVDDAGLQLQDQRRVDVDVIIPCLGREPPTALWGALGIDLERRFTPRRAALALVVFLGVYSLYAIKKFPELPSSWPFPLLVDETTMRAVVGAVFSVAFAPFHWLLTESAQRDVDATLWFQQGYLYSLAYTVVMLVFGRQALLRWTAVARDPTVQRRRYASLLAFQVVFFVAANVVAVQGLSVQYSWRAWGLYQPWPLFFNTFHWWNESDPRAVIGFFVGAGLVGTFVIIPVLARRHGKRFCSYVCGCGGLAETLGDRWRHLAPKGARSRRLEVQGYAVLVAAAVVTLVSVGAYQTRADNAWALAYAYIVDFWLVAVIPIALYPFFGGKVWCRYWCPLAAWNQLLAAAYGRLGIAAKEGCISCGQCSRQCQVGVDVMAFATRQERFDNRNSSCIQCGICIDVCPVSVLHTDLRPKGRSLPIVP